MKVFQNLRHLVLAIASAVVCLSGNAHANSFGIGLAPFSSSGVYDTTGLKRGNSLSTTPYVITGDAWYHETVGPDTITFLISKDIFGMDFNGTVWSDEFDLVDVAVDWGYRIRIINFQGGYYNTSGSFQALPTDAMHYNSLPIHTTFSKKLMGNFTPYATVGFGPFGLFNRKDNGRYNSFEAGLDWQFADSWKLTASYNKTHDETSTKGSGNPMMFQHDSTMLTGNIYYTW